MSTTPTDEEMEHWLKLDQEATPGPWEAGIAAMPGVVHFDGDDIRYIASVRMDSPNAALIVAYRTAVPALVERVRELEADAARRDRTWAEGWTEGYRQKADQLLARAEAAEAELTVARREREEWFTEYREQEARAEAAEAEVARVRDLNDRCNAALVKEMARAEAAEAEVERLSAAYAAECDESLAVHVRLSRLIEENARLNREIEMHGDKHIAMYREIDQLKAENARLREALRKYGRHTWQCQSMHDDKLDCTCDLDAALAGTGEP